MKDFDQLIEDQLFLEESAKDRGIARFWNQQATYEEKGIETRSAPVASLYAGLVDPLEKRIQHWLDSVDDLYAKTKKVPEEVRAAAFARELGAAKCAVIAARCVCDRLSSLPVAQIQLIRDMGKAFKDEWMVHVALKNDKGLFDDTLRRLDKSNKRFQRTYLSRSAKNALERKNVNIADSKVRDVVGHAMLSSMLEVWPVIEQGWIKTGKSYFKMALSVELAADARTWIDECLSKRQDLFPPLPHMVVPPKRWAKDRTGGFIGGLGFHVPMVKSRGEEYSESEMSDLTRETLSDMMSVPFQFNPDLVGIWREVAMMGTTDAKFPPRSPIEDEYPAHPGSEDPKALKDWKRKVQLLKNEAAERNTNMFVVANALSEVERMAEYDKIYAVLTADFRGRNYPATSAISYHGAKWQRGIYRFAEGKALTKEGAYWLAIHIANSMDDCRATGMKLSKEDFDTRYQWVIDNQDLIVKCADDWTYAFEFWSKADDPWNFLAGCKEWKGWLEHGTDWVCHLPVGVDGTCNGLQHYAALMLDPVMAESVNLKPMPKPADIYKLAAQIVIDKLKAFISEDGTIEQSMMSTFWLASGQVNRSLTKPPAMTRAYGVTPFGAAKQLRKEMDKRGFKRTAEQMQFLSDLVWEAVEKLTPAASQAMQWLRDMSKLIAAGTKDKPGAPMWWTTPSSNLIVQSSSKVASARVRTFFHGVCYKPQFRYFDDEQQDPVRAANGTPPNFIHSLDSSHLILTARAMFDLGCRHLMFVHDNYATHPNDVPLLNRVLREEFVKIYSNDVWGQLTSEIIAQVPAGVEYPEPPKRGSFDIRQVLDSKFFFG